MTWLINFSSTTRFASLLFVFNIAESQKRISTISNPRLISKLSIDLLFRYRYWTKWMQKKLNLFWTKLRTKTNEAKDLKESLTFDIFLKRNRNDSQLEWQLNNLDGSIYNFFTFNNNRKRKQTSVGISLTTTADLLIECIVPCFFISILNFKPVMNWQFIQNIIEILKVMFNFHSSLSFNIQRNLNFSNIFSAYIYIHIYIYICWAISTEIDIRYREKKNSESFHILTKNESKKHNYIILLYILYYIILLYIWYYIILSC